MFDLACNFTSVWLPKIFPWLSWKNILYFWRPLLASTFFLHFWPPSLASTFDLRFGHLGWVWSLLRCFAIDLSWKDGHLQKSITLQQSLIKFLVLYLVMFPLCNVKLKALCRKDANSQKKRKISWTMHNGIINMMIVAWHCILKLEPVAYQLIFCIYHPFLNCRHLPAKSATLAS